MATAASISLSQLTSAVQTAVKAAVEKHPKFKIDAPSTIAVSYLIRGIPVPEALLASMTLGETQSFANDLAAGLGSAAGVSAAGLKGAVYSNGKFIIVGIPPIEPFFIGK